MLAETNLRVCAYRAGTAMAPHEHGEASINLVVNGGFLERIGKGERSYSRGHVAIVPAGVRHSQVFGTAGARQIIFKPADGWLDYLADSKTELDAAPHAQSPTFRHLGDRLLDEIRHDDGFSAVACEGLLLEVVAAFGRVGAAAKSRAKPPTWLSATREFLHENVGAPFSMEQVAHVAGRHEIHVAREFRRFFGFSVGGYLRRLRTERAAELVLNPERSISEIALDCGFSSHSHLCREFKAQFGVSPSQYRSRHRE